MSIMGIIWSKKNWINVFIKTIIFSKWYILDFYALYLSNILLVVHKS